MVKSDYLIKNAKELWHLLNQTHRSLKLKQFNNLLNQDGTRFNKKGKIGKNRDKLIRNLRNNAIILTFTLSIIRFQNKI